MTSRYFRVMIALTIASVTLQSCASTRVIPVSELDAKYDGSIEVYCSDGRIVEFRDTDYSLVTTDSGGVLKGNGREFAPQRRDQWRGFDGVISFAEIDSVRIAEFSTAAETTGLVLVIVGLTAIALILWATSIDLTGG
jgi:hypothetical protein